MNKQCPICLSTNVRSYQIKTYIGPGPPDFKKIYYDGIEDHCFSCGEIGDFYAENDSAIEEAIRRMNND